MICRMDIGDLDVTEKGEVTLLSYGKNNTGGVFPNRQEPIVEIALADGSVEPIQMHDIHAVVPVEYYPGVGVQHRAKAD